MYLSIVFQRKIKQCPIQTYMQCEASKKVLINIEKWCLIAVINMVNYIVDFNTFLFCCYFDE